LCTLVFLIADFSLALTPALFSSFFFFFLLSSPWSFVGVCWALGSSTFFFFLASSAFLSWAGVSPSPFWEVETEGCFLFLTRVISSSSSSSSS
jgi:hypothetical protein